MSILMRNVLVFMMAMAMLLGPMSPAQSVDQADSSFVLSKSDLQLLADELIAVETCITEQYIETRYFELQAFYRAAREQFPLLSDEELVDFVVHHLSLNGDDVGSDYSSVLSAVEITVVTQYMVETFGGGIAQANLQDAEALFSDRLLTEPQNEWQSSDNYMKITYYAYRYEATEEGVPYYFTSYFTWLMIPDWQLFDTMAIVHTGVLDDNYPYEAYLYYVGRCSFCGDEVSQVYSDVYEGGRFTSNSSYVELDFSQDNAFGARISLSPTGCFHTTALGSLNHMDPSYLAGYLKCHVLVTELGQMKPVYVHTIVSADITIGATVSNGVVEPSISGALALDYTKYIGAPITIRIA